MPAKAICGVAYAQKMGNIECIRVVNLPLHPSGWSCHIAMHSGAIRPHFPLFVSLIFSLGEHRVCHCVGLSLIDLHLLYLLSEQVVNPPILPIIIHLVQRRPPPQNRSLRRRISGML